MKLLLSPRSIALIGVSSDTEKISGRLLPILQAHRYSGRIYPINPKRFEIGGLACYASLADLPETPDVAVLLVPNSAVPDVVQQAVDIGVPYVMVYSSGFNESGADGERIAKEVQGIIAGTSTRLVGPNSEGFYDLQSSVALSFSPVIDASRGRKPLQSGDTVIISQSGGLGFAIADQLEHSGIGIRSVVTTGNELDLEVADFIRYYAEEPSVKRIVLFAEGAKDLNAWRNAFLEAKRNGKRVFSIQIGRSVSGMKAVGAHTGKVPRTVEEISQVFTETGVMQFSDLDDLIDAAVADVECDVNTPVSAKEGSDENTSDEAKARSTATAGNGAGNRIAIVSTSGGGGIWCADLATEYGLSVASPTAAITEELRGILPGYASLLNPIDVTAQAIFDGSLVQALATLLSSDEFDGTLIVGTLGYDHKLIQDAAFQSALKHAKSPVVVFSYTPPNAEAQALLRSLGVPYFTSPKRAVRALAQALGVQGAASNDSTFANNKRVMGVEHA